MRTIVATAVGCLIAGLAVSTVDAAASVSPAMLAAPSSAAFTVVGTETMPILVARRAADDPAGHVRQGRGADDAAGAVRQGRGADDPAGAARQGRGADNPPGDVRRGRGADNPPGDVRRGRGRGQDDPLNHG